MADLQLALPRRVWNATDGRVAASKVARVPLEAFFEHARGGEFAKVVHARDAIRAIYDVKEHAPDFMRNPTLQVRARRLLDLGHDTKTPADRSAGVSFWAAPRRSRVVGRACSPPAGIRLILV